VRCKLQEVSYIVSKRHELWSTNGFKLEVSFHSPSVKSAFHFIAPVLFLPACGSKLTTFSDDVDGPQYFPSHLSDYLCHVSFRRYSPSSLEVVEKPIKCIQVFGPNFSGGTTPTFPRHIVSAIYFLPFGKVWLSSVCWSLSAKAGNEAECTIYAG